LIQNLNPDFNAIWVQAIMEIIQRMALDGSPLALLAQQGAEAAELVGVDGSVGRHGEAWTPASGGTVVRR
jgi:hypothetical protein